MQTMSAALQDGGDEGGAGPDPAHHPHPLHVLPLDELLRRQGEHLQGAHRQVRPHLHGQKDSGLMTTKNIKFQSKGNTSHAFG